MPPQPQLLGVRRSRSFWASAALTPLLFAVMALQGAIIPNPLGGVTGTQLFLFCLLIPCCGWMSAALVSMNAIGALNLGSGESANRFVEEAYHESGRPMAGMVLAHVLLSCLLALPMVAIVIGLHCWWGTITDPSLLCSPLAWSGYLCTALSVFVTVAAMILSSGHNTNELVLAMMVTLVPIIAVMTVVIIALTLCPLAIPPLAIVVIAVTMAVAIRHCRRRYTDTFRSLG